MTASSFSRRFGKRANIEGDTSGRINLEDQVNIGKNMGIIELSYSTFGPVLGIFLGAVLPTKQAYRLADRIAANVVSQTDSELYRALRTNQAVVRGLAYDDPQLDDIMLRVMQNATRGYADWFKGMAKGRQYLLERCHLEDHLMESALQAREDGRGLLMVGGHMSSFNIMMLGLGVLGLPIKVLSFADPGGSYKIDNIIRKRYGLELAPISVSSLKEAIRRLKNGGLVLTGIDRPDVGGEPLEFFGTQVVMPVGHARLAIRTGSRIMIGATTRIGPAQYKVYGPEVIEPEISGNYDKDVKRLAQRTLHILEGQIRARPDEWLMFFPIWPEKMPAQSSD
jgi:KDO2-lipid IV(A) lauroyltransferase